MTDYSESDKYYKIESQESIIPQEETPQSPPMDFSHYISHIIYEHDKQNEKLEHYKNKAEEYKSKFEQSELEKDHYKGLYEALLKNQVETKGNIILYDDIRAILHDYNYSTAYFTKNTNVDALTKSLIVLAQQKRGFRKWVIGCGRDWLFVYIILKDKFFKGNLNDFCNYINDEVLPKIADKKRRDDVNCNYNNLVNACKNNPAIKYHVYQWRIEYGKNRKLVTLERAINILSQLEKIFPLITINEK